MKICYFGIYDKNYGRNRVLMAGLSENGHTVVECHIDPKISLGISKYWHLYQEYKKVKGETPDLVLVAFPGHTVMGLARILFPRKKIIFDAFLSLYDSNVLDRQLYGPKSLRGMRDWLLDWSACLLATQVLLDTNQYIDYFVCTFHVPKRKLIRVPICADESLFFPRDNGQKDEKKIIHFHGMFIPLQGIRTIIEAAELARNQPWLFRIVGSGQEFKTIEILVQEKKLTNVALVGKVPLEQVPGYIATATVCLGIFGATKKTARVIPNKVYECMAMNKPVITADTLAIREYFTEGENIFLCEIDNAESLYRALQKVLDDPISCVRVAEASRKLFQARFTSRMIVADMLKSLSYAS